MIGAFVRMQLGDFATSGRRGFSEVPPEVLKYVMLMKIGAADVL